MKRIGRLWWWVRTEREEDGESTNGDCGLGFGDKVIRIGASQRTIDGGFEGI